MKRLIKVTQLVLVATAFVVATFEPATAQQRRTTVSGVVADADTRAGVTGALVAISPVADSTVANHIVSGAGGVFSAGTARGEFNITVSLLGYDTARQRVDISSRTALDTIFLRQGIQIDAVVKEAMAMRTSTDGDTLIYNADAYKVAADADVSGLLQKMPGIKVSGGTVEAQGEQVQKVLIDGREFFGEDVSAAIAALPAEAVKSIEVFDKLSDNAEFTGIDDGEGYKAINIKTRENMRQGVMGQVSGSYGVEPPDKNDDKWHHYGLVSGNVSIFHGDAKITVGGTVNNLNERHFTHDDILGVGDNDGIAKVGRFQANYIDSWGKKNQWNVDATYSYNITGVDDNARIEREYYEGAGALYRNYYSQAFADAIDQSHRFRARIDFKPNSFHELRIRPFVRYQGNRSGSTGEEIFYPVDDTAPDIVLDNWNNSLGAGLFAGLNANYRVRLGKPGRTLSLFFNGVYNFGDTSGESYYDKQDGTFERQRSLNDTWGYNLMGGVTYTEPVSPSSLINLDYTVGYNYSDQDRRSYLWDDTLTPPGYSTDPDPDYSGVYNSGYITHRVGPGYRMQSKKTTLAAGMFYQYSVLGSDRVLPGVNSLTADFHNVTYSVMLNSKFGKGGSVRVFLNSRTRNPGVGDLQDVVDISRSQNITKGNPRLRPSYDNRLRVRFILPNVEKGRTLSFRLNASYTFNAIARRTISESPGYEVKDVEGNTVATLDEVGRYSQPVNMNGEWQARFGVDYGFPLNFMKSNLNVNAGVSYGESPSEMGRWTLEEGEVFTRNRSRNLAADGGLTLGSNISEKIDFRISYNISYNNVRNTFSKSSNSDYLRHIASADMKFVLPLDFTISSTLMFDGYNMLSGENFGQRNRNFFIASAAVGKKIFRDRSGEVSLFVSDIFNQNVSFRRSAYAQYIQNEINSVVGRYFGVKLTWNIRYFGKNATHNASLYGTDNHENDRHGAPAGPPPGGGGHDHGGGGRGGFGGGMRGF